MLTATKRKAKIGPRDHGLPMSLKAFELALTVPGYHYELSRGYVTVSEPAGFWHALIVVMIRDCFVAHRLANPDDIYMVLTETGTKLVIPSCDSERHPDISVYFTRPKGPKNRKIWRTWVPEIVVEVVSERSTDRDYIEKREEYWTHGVKEYWIVDTQREQIVTLRRGKADWIEKRLGRDDVCTTKLLPGFKLDCKSIFDAAADAGDE